MFVETIERALIGLGLNEGKGPEDNDKEYVK